MKLRVPLSRAAALGIAFALSLGVGVTALAATSSSAKPLVYHGCEGGTRGRIIYDVYSSGHRPTCPAGAWAVSFNQTGPAGTPGTNGTNGTSYTPVTATANTSVSDWPESSGWANDNFDRTLSITLQHAASSAKCGGTPVCFFFTFTLRDTGSFTTVDGKASPNGSSSDTVHGTNTGTMNGVANGELYASSANISAANVATAVTGSQHSATLNTTDWAEQAFPAGTTFAGVNLTAYDFQYVLTSTCEAWNDQITPGDDGQGAADGNITGVSQCAAS